MNNELIKEQAHHRKETANSESTQIIQAKFS